MLLSFYNCSFWNILYLSWSSDVIVVLACQFFWLRLLLSIPPCSRWTHPWQCQALAVQQPIVITPPLAVRNHYVVHHNLVNPTQPGYLLRQDPAQLLPWQPVPASCHGRYVQWLDCHVLDFGVAFLQSFSPHVVCIRMGHTSNPSWALLTSYSDVLCEFDYPLYKCQSFACTLLVGFSGPYSSPGSQPSLLTSPSRCRKWWNCAETERSIWLWKWHNESKLCCSFVIMQIPKYWTVPSSTLSSHSQMSTPVYVIGCGYLAIVLVKATCNCPCKCCWHMCNWLFVFLFFHSDGTFYSVQFQLCVCAVCRLVKGKLIVWCLRWETWKTK